MMKGREEKPVHVANIVRHGESIVVPESMKLEDAITVLDRQMKDEEQIIAITETVDAFPWEGAIAFRKAITQMFGYTSATGTPSFFGMRPPAEITIETGVDTKTTAPWGRFRFALGGDKEWLGTGVDTIDGRMVFQVEGEVKKKWKNTVLRLVDLTRQIVREESIYRGQALRISFTDSNGRVEALPQPKFIDLRKVDINELVYTKDLTQLIETNILTPLKHTDECRAAGIPIKRGILAAGPYGTGKSLLARAVAKVATSASPKPWTFLYIKDAKELPHAIKFAQQYQPCVIFAEDVDRFMAGGRTAEMDTILNTLDGIDSKSGEIMVILTTNHLDQINRAMLRPGRLDVILNIVPPDAEAVQRLINVYGRDQLSPKTNLEIVGSMLAGFTPAIIREVVERAKLAAISRTGRAGTKIEGVDIEVSAKTMVQQQDLLKEPEVEKPDPFTMLKEGIVQGVKKDLKANGLGMMEERVEKLTRYHDLE